MEILPIITTIIFLLTTLWLIFKPPKKDYDLIHDSQKKAQAIIAAAELEAIKLLSSSKISTGKIGEGYNQQLSQITSQYQQSLIQLTNKFNDFLVSLQQTSSQTNTQVQEEVKNRADKIFEDFEGRLTNFLIQTEQQSTSSIELELKSTRQLIDAYRQQQLTLIDENIIAMMEQTLSIVLAKKLSLKDQLDLVYEALEKAKVEKFII